MALSGPDCASAEFFEIHYGRPGGIVETTGIGPIGSLEATLAAVSSLGPIVSVIISNSDHRLIDCCPPDYSFTDGVG